MLSLTKLTLLFAIALIAVNAQDDTDGTGAGIDGDGGGTDVDDTTTDTDVTDPGTATTLDSATGQFTSDAMH